jgi:hypothetical protein
MADQPTSDPIQAGWAALHAGDWREARRLFEASLHARDSAEAHTEGGAEVANQ